MIMEEEEVLAVTDMTITKSSLNGNAAAGVVDTQERITADCENAILVSSFDHVLTIEYDMLLGTISSSQQPGVSSAGSK